MSKYKFSYLFHSTLFHILYQATVSYDQFLFPDEPQLMITAGPGMGMPPQGGYPQQQMPGMYAQPGYQMSPQGPMPGYGM